MDLFSTRFTTVLHHDQFAYILYQMQLHGIERFYVMKNAGNSHKANYFFWIRNSDITGQEIIMNAMDYTDAVYTVCIIKKIMIYI